MVQNCNKSCTLRLAVAKSFVKKAELSTVSPAPRVPPGWEVRARAETHPTRAMVFQVGHEKAGCR